MMVFPGDVGGVWMKCKVSEEQLERANEESESHQCLDLNAAKLGAVKLLSVQINFSAFLLNSNV